MFGVLISCVCPVCKKENFLTDFNPFHCRVLGCGALVEPNKQEIQEKLIKELVKDRDGWKNLAISLRQLPREKQLVKLLNCWVLV